MSILSNLAAAQRSYETDATEYLTSPEDFCPHAEAARIRRAVRDAGYDPEILDRLPPTYVIAALILGVK